MGEVYPSPAPAPVRMSMCELCVTREMMMHCELQSHSGILYTRHSLYNVKVECDVVTATVYAIRVCHTAALYSVLCCVVRPTVTT